MMTDAAVRPDKSRSTPGQFLTSLPVLLLFPLLLAVLVGCSDERGGWQEAKWGMTPEQVVAAMKGTAILVTPDEKFQINGNTWFPTEDTKVWQRSYSLNGKPWVVFFKYDADGLNKVTLSPYTSVDASFAQQILGGLRTNFGEPSSREEGCVARGPMNVKSEQHDIRWTTPKTNVRLYYWSALCNETTFFLSIEYVRGGEHLKGKL